MFLLSTFFFIGCTANNQKNETYSVQQIRQGGNAKRDEFGIPAGQSHSFYMKLLNVTESTIKTLKENNSEVEPILYKKVEALKVTYLKIEKPKENNVEENPEEGSVAAPPPRLSRCSTGDKPVEIVETVSEGSRMQFYSRLVDPSGSVLTTKKIGNIVKIKEDAKVKFVIEQGNSHTAEEIYVTDESGVFINQVAKITLTDFNGGCVNEITGKDRYSGRMATYESDAQFKWQLGLRLIP